MCVFVSLIFIGSFGVQCRVFSLVWTVAEVVGFDLCREFWVSVSCVFVSLNFVGSFGVQFRVFSLV